MFGCCIPRNPRQAITAFTQVDPAVPVIQKFDPYVNAHMQQTCGSQNETDRRQMQTPAEHIPYVCLG